MNVEGMPSPGQVSYWVFPGQVLFSVITFLGVACFTYILARRVAPILRSAPDPRCDHIFLRLKRTLQYWLMQWKQPRYAMAGILHVAIFAGFLALAFRSLALVMVGFSGDFASSVFSGKSGDYYDLVKDYAATIVFVAALIAAIRRAVFKPTRYRVPAKYGSDHTAEAVFILGLIALLLVSESLFSASESVYQSRQGAIAEMLPTLTLSGSFQNLLLHSPQHSLWNLHFSAYLVHELTFFLFLCFLPLGKHFHVVTSLFNVYFGKLRRGAVKPVRWDVADDHLDQVSSFGVKKFEDFTWKQMLDFYSCADCGRCSDQCPANAVGRPLSPRFLTLKARDYAFRHYPLLGHSRSGEVLVGGIYSDDEIWSCTTCGACEEECPLMMEYVDKIVDLRRGMIDEGNVPQSLQKPLKALESRGNPYGKPEKKRAEWVRDKDFEQTCQVKALDGTNTANTLYFVDSITSYDSRIQAIGRATARMLTDLNEDFGVLGTAERDSGHDVRRFGEEMLFLALREQNVEAIKASGVQRIVTADPHAFNTLKNDYKDVPPVEHISEVIARGIATGSIHLRPVTDSSSIYTYHDPCYLGRHNQIYDAPRNLLDAIPGLKRVEMKRCRDRSFCCGGGGLALFYEPKEEERMGVLRVRMAAEAGANVIVTACPFCMVNIEDAIKVAGMEGKMSVIDLAELVDRQVIRAGAQGELEQQTVLCEANASRASVQ